MDFRISTLMSAKGRLTRQEYLIANLVILVTCLLFLPISFLFSLAHLDYITPKVYAFLTILQYYCQIVSSIKRCHDIGRSGYFYGIPMILAFLAPCLALLVGINCKIDLEILLFSSCVFPLFWTARGISLLFIDSKKGTNKWGSSKKYPDANDSLPPVFASGCLEAKTASEHQQYNSAGILTKKSKTIIIVVGFILLCLVTTFFIVACSTANKLKENSRQDTYSEFSSEQEDTPEEQSSTDYLSEDFDEQ